jgi:hypothetical protein
MSKEALQLALEALEICEQDGYIPVRLTRDAITAIKQALEQPEERYTYGTPLLDSFAKPAPVQEPVAWMDRDGDLYANEPDKNWCPPHYPLYTTPPAQEIVCSTGLCHYRKPQQEPVAWMAESKNGNVRFTNIGQSADQLESFGWTISPLYAAPFQLQPLTGEDVLECWKKVYEPGRREHDNATRMARAIEAAHGIKENT